MKDVSQQLEGSLSSSSFLEETGPVPLDDVAQKASTLAAAREKIIKQVRKIPGFELFLRPKTFDKLTPAAYEGPVAIINIHKLRCGALVLIPHNSLHPTASIVHIPLESFSYEMSMDLFLRFRRLLSSAGVRAQNVRKSERESHCDNSKDLFGNILYDLWVHVVKPIIDGLAYQPGDHSRIW